MKKLISFAYFYPVLIKNEDYTSVTVVDIERSVDLFLKRLISVFEKFSSIANVKLNFRKETTSYTARGLSRTIKDGKIIGAVCKLEFEVFIVDSETEERLIQFINSNYDLFREKFQDKMREDNFKVTILDKELTKLVFADASGGAMVLGSYFDLQIVNLTPEVTNKYFFLDMYRDESIKTLKELYEKNNSGFLHDLTFFDIKPKPISGKDVMYVNTDGRIKCVNYNTDSLD